MISDVLRPGQILEGTYEVREPIGEGTAGLVYKGWHMRLCKTVAIKKIKEKYVGRFNERGEADILKSLRHQYLPVVYDFIQNGTEVYTIMDFIEGHTAAWYIEKGFYRKPKWEKTVIRWTVQLLEALEYIHGQVPAVIHGDIKPANIMVDRKGDICLIDFNISLLSGGSAASGGSSGYSPNFASPEQKNRRAMYESGKSIWI